MDPHNLYRCVLVLVVSSVLRMAVQSQEVTPTLEIPGVVGPKTYTNVRVLSVVDQNVKISHDGGLAVIPASKLPKDWLSKFAPSAAIESTPPTSEPVKAGNVPQGAGTTSFDPNCLVFIKTDTGAGSGFIAAVDGVVYVYTNAHVICGSPGGVTSKIVSIKTAAGREIPPPFEIELSDTYDPASPRGLEDAARFVVNLKEGESAYVLGSLNAATSMRQKIVAYGNSLGGDVVTSLDGEIVGLGTDRIEISAEIVPGNSGGPVVLPDTKQVIGISTYATTGERNIWTQGTIFGDVRRFAVRPEKITKWRKMQFTSLISAISELKAFDRDTLSLAAACYLNPKPNRGGFDVPTVKNGDFVVRQVILDGSKHSLGAAISGGIARVNQRLGGPTAKMSMQAVVPVFAEFFATVAQASSSQIDSLRAVDRAPYLKKFVPELIEQRKKAHAAFVSEGASRYR